MIFNTFCNICFIKRNIIKLSEDENERILNILISFTSCPDIVHGNIYLCTSCCTKLEEYDKFRELLLTNFVRFRYLYKEHRRKLRIRHEPDIKDQLQTFVEVNLDRASGTPLIESLEDVKKVAKALRNNHTYVDTTCVEHECDFEIDLDELLQKNGLMRTENSFNPEINALKHETENCQMNYKDRKTINGNTIAEEICTLGLLEEASSSLHAEKEQKFSEIETINLEEDELNPEPFEQSYDQLLSDPITNDVLCHKSTDDISDLSNNPENCVTENAPIEEVVTGTSEETLEITISNNCSTKSKISVARRRGRKARNKENLTEKKCTRSTSSKLNTISEQKRESLKCKICNKSFSLLRNLKSHENLHNRTDVHKCDHCQMIFLTKSDLKKHEKEYRKKKQKKGKKNVKSRNLKVTRVPTRETCTWCPMCKKSVWNFKVHNLTHRGQKPYKCNVCEKQYSYFCSWVTHQRLHVKQTFKCLKCEKSFITLNNLKAHELKRCKSLHIEKKGYQCSFCRKEFSSKNLLKLHIKVHSDTKTYKCIICRREFPNFSSLKSHKHTHKKASTYKCKICTKYFSTLTQLNKHKDRHIKCTTCNKIFHNYIQLKRHERYEQMKQKLKKN